MCDTRASRGRRPSLPRPQWTLLYGVVGLGLGATAITAFLAPPDASRTILEATLAVSAFSAVAGWIRSNRVPLDLLDWCDCAGAKTVIRVILSERLPLDKAGRRRAFDDTERRWVLGEPEGLEELEEETSVAIRR